ncbi:hypothetical protein [Neptuniibacter sp. QD37_11]|uniref:hypothetical protein n=1 Tax=Neptuniibacter sp. QD37_11 TaxID=3398209 RepID=UPI0039F4A619
MIVIANKADIRALHEAFKHALAYQLDLKLPHAKSLNLLGKAILGPTANAHALRGFMGAGTPAQVLFKELLLRAFKTSPQQLETLFLSLRLQFDEHLQNKPFRANSASFHLYKLLMDDKFQVAQISRHYVPPAILIRTSKLPGDFKHFLERNLEDLKNISLKAQELLTTRTAKIFFLSGIHPTYYMKKMPEELIKKTYSLDFFEDLSDQELTEFIGLSLRIHIQSISLMFGSLSPSLLLHELPTDPYHIPEEEIEKWYITKEDDFETFFCRHKLIGLHNEIVEKSAGTSDCGGLCIDPEHQKKHMPSFLKHGLLNYIHFEATEDICSTVVELAMEHFKTHIKQQITYSFEKNFSDLIGDSFEIIKKGKT